MALRTRGDYFGLHTGIDARELYRTSRLVSDLLGIPVPPNKAVVGGNAFSHSSGIHVDGFLKERETYEIMRPEDVGIGGEPRGPDGAHRPPRLRDRLEKLGYTLSPSGVGSGLPAIPGRRGQEAGGVRRGLDRHPARRNPSRCPRLTSSNICRSTAARRPFPPPPCGCACRDGNARRRRDRRRPRRCRVQGDFRGHQDVRQAACATRSAPSPAAPKPWAR